VYKPYDRERERERERERNPPYHFETSMKLGPNSYYIPLVFNMSQSFAKLTSKRMT